MALRRSSLLILGLAAGCAVMAPKRAPYPAAWAVQNPEVAREFDAVMRLATAKFTGLRVGRIAFSSDWRVVRHTGDGQVLGRVAVAMIALHEDAKQRCLLAEVEVWQPRGEAAEGWGPLRLRNDHLKERPPRDVPTVYRIGPDKQWWTLPLQQCPNPSAP